MEAKTAPFCRRHFKPIFLKENCFFCYMIDWCCDAIYSKWKIILEIIFDKNSLSSLKDDRRPYRRWWTPKMVFLATTKHYISAKLAINEDVIPWKHFLHYWSLWGESTGHQWILHKWPVMRSFGVFFDADLSKPSYQQPSCRWFEMSWRNVQ